MPADHPFIPFIRKTIADGGCTNDDVVAMMMPLLEEVFTFHEINKVAPLDNTDTLLITNEKLDIDEHLIKEPSYNFDTIHALFPKDVKAFEISGEEKSITEIGERTTISNINLQFQKDVQVPIDRAVFLPNYKCFEISFQHHDAATDVFILGLIMASLSLGLDFTDADDMEEFVRHRESLIFINSKIHPAIANLIIGMTELNRKKRLKDLAEIIEKLKNYREYNPENQIDLSLIAGKNNISKNSKSQFIHKKLRSRLFDLSRRNRLLYFKPNMKFINLTVASVPSVLNYRNIQPESLFTWNNDIASKVSNAKDISLSKYVRFEDNGYIAPNLDRIRSEANKDINEYGFSQLKLAVAFLHWYNIKEDLTEKISTPLVLVAVNLVKKKGLKDQYIVEIADTEAEINPVLLYQLRELYNIQLPETIQLNESSLHDVYTILKQQIDNTQSGITLVLSDKPKIKLIHAQAKQTLNQFRKKLNRNRKLQTYHNLDYSYAADNFQPLGLQLYKNYVQQSHSSLEFLINDDIKPNTHLFAEAGSTRELYSLDESAINPYKWEFDLCHIILGNFNYKKMSLVSDYNDIIDNNKSNPVFDLLFDDAPKNINQQEENIVAFNDLYNVVASDPTQNKAIYKARQNTSYIIQGPPGTGKSQTITNLIADYVANGKKVLFVCEKRAAIDVVYYRLKQENLDELCCLIHDSQADKKEFILNLKQNYELNLKNNTKIEDVVQQRNDVIQYIQQELKIIEHFSAVMQQTIPSADLTSIELYQKLIELADVSKEMHLSDIDELVGYKEWKRFGETIQKLYNTLQTNHQKNNFAEHPISHLNDLVFETAPTPTELKNKLQEIAALTEEISEYLELTDFNDNYKENIVDLKKLLENIDELQLFLQVNQLQLLNEQSAAYQDFIQIRNELSELDKDIESIQQKNKNWKQKFSETDTENALQIAQQLENSFLRIFYGSYRKMRSSLNASYDFTQHQVKPKYSQVLQQLQQEYTIINLQNKKANEAEKKYQLGNVEEAFVKIKECRQQLHQEIKTIIQQNNSNNQIRDLIQIKTKFDRLFKLIIQVLDNRNIDKFPAIEKTVESILPVVNDFNLYLPYLRELINASPKLKQLLKTEKYSVREIENILAQKSMADFHVLHRELQKIEGSVLEFHIERIKKLHQQYSKINSTYIRAKQREKFMKLILNSEMSVAGKTSEEKEEKRLLLEGRKILENEFSKTIRYKSIRELATAESGKIIRELKPVWLMSPLSVSDTLPLNTQYFDVVIFDEASQITLEEGIPPIFRASQAIVVGDEMQMPPSNFFSSSQNDIDDLWQDEDDHQNQLALDADSLLNQAARKLSSVLLGWHYRSRHESLISFSNAAFYENQLLTIPDKTDLHQSLNTIEVNNISEAKDFLTHLFDRPISYHHLKNGVYESRSNETEANYIAEILYQFYKNEHKESIGIVAFSMEQQGEIEDAIHQKAQQDKDFDKWLEDEYKRIEDNQFIGLFIKNLENVQGDERDIIIISTCYGYDRNGRMIMNFGPINKKGGEKRLNVIFSRAKKHVCVVSSIQHTDIKNEYNEGANYFKKYLHYAALMNTGSLAHAQSILNTLTLQQLQEKNSINHLQQQICDELNKAGYFTKMNIGQSHFKCHIGVKRNENDKQYILGILLDDDSHYRNGDLLEQYLLKPTILKNFGWNILQVYAKDWLENKAKTLQQIINLIDGKNVESESVNLNVVTTEELLNKRIELTENKQKELVENFNSPVNTNTIRLTFAEDNSNKFWQVTQNKNTLIIEFGKINTNGQKIIKPYDDDETAEKEMKKLIDQKKKKGYQ
ncbi:MAG: AAA domain-containing protein [Chitinophagales bacterium]